MPLSRVKGKYGENDKFTFILSLVFFQCIFNAIISKTILLIRQTPRDTTPSVMYAFSSFTYLFAMLASNYALEFVSYPMQVLGKSVKPVPVMLLGVLVARKRYPLVKYLYVSLIVMGKKRFAAQMNAHGAFQAWCCSCTRNRRRRRKRLKVGASSVWVNFFW